MIKDSKGKKISTEELSQIYKNKSNDKDFGDYLTYDGNDSQILEVVKRINRRRSPKDPFGNYTNSFLDYLQSKAFELAGIRKFARVMRMTFDPDFSSKVKPKQLELTTTFGEWIDYYSLSDQYSGVDATYREKEDKEFNDKVERFAQAYKIKIPETKMELGGSLNPKLFSDYDFDEDGNPLGKTIASEIFLNKDKYKSLENKNLILSSNREYNFDREQSKDNKPRGLWYAKGFEWIDLLIENIGGIFPLAKYTRLYEIEVTDKVLKLIDEKDAIQFTKEYGAKTDFDKEYLDERYSEIDWKKVAKNYSGIELSTQLALNSHYTKRKRILNWTSGWDIGSGCIWDKSGIDKITLIMEEDNMEFKKGGKVTWRNKYNKKYGFDKDESHSLKDISKKSGVSMKGLQQIYNKGIGAYKTNPSSVRPNVTSKEQWAMGRVYSAVMGGKASKVDAKELKMVKGGNVSTISYEDWKNAYIILNNEVDKKSLLLNNKYPTNSSGLIEEKVRMSEEYQKVKKDFDKSFKKLQDFNKASPKQYQKRYRDEKRASWRMVKGGNVRTREQVISDINKLNEQSRSGKIPYAKYYRAYEKLRKEAEAIKRYNSFPQIMKRFGASVKKAYGRGSYYYIGKHIDAEIKAEDTSMGERWEVTTVFDKKRFGSEPRLQNVIKAEFEDDYLPYETKKEATTMLYNIDSGIDDGKIDKNMQSEYNYAKGGLITPQIKDEFEAMKYDDRLPFIQKTFGKINGMPIVYVYEEFEGGDYEEWVVVLNEMEGENRVEISLEYEFEFSETEDEDGTITIEKSKIRRMRFSKNSEKGYEFHSYDTITDHENAFDNLKNKGESIFDTMDDFKKFMAIIDLERMVSSFSFKLPKSLKTKYVVTKNMDMFTLPNPKKIFQEVKKKFKKVYSSKTDEFMQRKGYDYKPYLLQLKTTDGKTFSDIKYEDFVGKESIRIYLSYKNENSTFDGFAVQGQAVYLSNGALDNIYLKIYSTNPFSKQDDFKLMDYSTDQKELIAFLRKELKKTKKLK